MRESLSRVETGNGMSMRSVGMSEVKYCSQRKMSVFFRKKITVAMAIIVCCVGLTMQGYSQGMRYYWVGDGDKTSWGDLMNWSSTSGGQGGIGIVDMPTANNTVVFNEYSKLINTGSVSAQRVVAVSGTRYCDSLIVENCTANTLPIFSISSTLNISGSLILQSGVSFSVYNTVIFNSSRPQETIKTSGASLLGGTTPYYSVYSYLEAQSIFNGSATYTLANNTVFQEVTLNYGALDLNGKDISCNRIFINANASITFAGSTIECRATWSNVNGNALTSLQTANSLIRIGTGNFLAKNGDVYHNVEFYMGCFSENTEPRHKISNGTYNKITILKGSTEIGNNNTITTDSLICSASGGLQLRRVTVNRYFEAKPAGCGGQIRLYGVISSNAADRTITMGSMPMVVIERAIIHDLIITGAAANAEKSYDWGNTSGFTFNPTHAPDAGRNLYWTGGGGYWSEPAHWSLTSDGLTPANCVPTLADNVFFGAGANTGGTNISSSNPVYLDMAVWCNDMTWNGVPNTPYLRLEGNATSSSTSKSDANPVGCIPNSDNICIGGSLTLQNSLNIVTIRNSSATLGINNFWFVGNNPNNTITTNTVPVSANFVFKSVSGSGGWKVTDNLTLYNQVTSTAENNTSASNLANIYFYSGHLDMSGIKVVADNFYSLENTVTPTGSWEDRLSSSTLNIANSTFDLYQSWQHLGGQLLTTVQSAGSLIVAGAINAAGSILTKSDDYYYNAEIRKYQGGSIYNRQPIIIGSTFFNKITLSGISATINAGSPGSIQPDSLLFTGYGTYTISHSMKVNKHIGTPPACGGLTNITASSPVTLTVGYDLPHAQRVKIRNTDMRNISIAPADTLYSVTDCNFAGTCNGWDNQNSPSQTFYWVGGTGNWSESENWSSKSGLNGGFKGDGTGCLPMSKDNVIFDDGSFTAPSQRVTMDVTAYCDSMLWIGANTLKPEFYINATLSIYGSLEFQSGMTISSNISNSTIYFLTNRGVMESIKTNNVVLKVNVLYFNAADKNCGWKLLDNLTVNEGNPYTNIDFLKGTLDLNEKTITGIIHFNGDNSTTKGERKLIMENATIKMHSIFATNFSYTGDLIAEGSTIAIIKPVNSFTFICEQNAQFHNLEITGVDRTYSFIIYRGNFNKITTTTGGITFNYSALDTIVVDTLIFAANTSRPYLFTSGSVLKVNEKFYVSGSACNPIRLQSTLQNTPAIFDIKLPTANYAGTEGNGVMDTLMINYAYIHGIKALTGPDNVHLYKAWLCPDENEASGTWGSGIGLGNYNTGWARMDAYAEGGSTPFEDYREVSCVFFPYYLSSVNFAPTPTSRMKWFKCKKAAFETIWANTSGSTSQQKFDNVDAVLPPISTDRDLLIFKGGSYTLLLDDGTGCVVYDDILIEMIIYDECRMVEKCDGEYLIKEDLPYKPGAYTNLEIETAPGSGDYIPLDLSSPLAVSLSDNGRIIIFSDVAEGGQFAMAYLVVSPLPGPPTVEPEDLYFCAQATVGNLVARMAGSGIKIYDSPHGLTPMDLSEMLVDEGKYYASQTVRTCEGTERLEIIVHFITPCPVWEIWNWEDLSMVMEKQEAPAFPYRYFSIMQDLGVPGQNNYGNGSDLAYSASGVQNTHKGDKRFGWYGYEGFIGGTGNIDTVTPFSAGWASLQARDNAARTAFNASNFTPDPNTGWNVGGWIPIGDATTSFTGTFYGQNFEISGLWINRTSSDYQGLFGVVSDASISNLGTHLSETGISAKHNVGVLVGKVGFNLAATDITNCYTTGNIEGDQYVGGLAGNVAGSAYITGCYTEGNVAGRSIVGGLAGQLGGTVGTLAKVSQCYAIGSVKGTDNKIGGFAGVSHLAKITNCYAAGKVKGVNNVGGFVGSTALSTISRCYASGDTVRGTTSVGGLVGEAQDKDTISENFSLVSTVIGTDAGRIMGFKNMNVKISNNTALLCMMVNDTTVTGVVSADDNNGANVSYTKAIQPNASTYTGKNWNFSEIWTFDYEYDNLSKSWNVSDTTNLPILQIFNRWDFPKTVQPPRAKCIKNCEIEILSGGAALDQTICLGMKIDTIIYRIGTSITDIQEPTDLPSGVNWTISNDSLIISGIPIADGEFNFALVPVGTCQDDTLKGTITVLLPPVLTSNNPMDEICSGKTLIYEATADQSVTFSWVRESISGITSSGTGSGNDAFINEILYNNTSSDITVTYKITMTTQGCSVTEDVLVTVTPKISVSATIKIKK